MVTRARGNTEIKTWRKDLMDRLVHGPMSEVRQVPENDTEPPKPLAYGHPTWLQLLGQRRCTARPLNCVRGHGAGDALF